VSTQQPRRSASTPIAPSFRRFTSAVRGPSRRRASGVTLVEVVVTLVVLATLTAFAVNGYTSFVRRARAAEALEQLDRFRTRMEKAFQDNGNYGVGACSVAVPTSVDSFNYGCTLASANQAFTATVTGFANVAGYQFSINEQGLRRTLAFPGATVPADCWMVEKNKCQ
jgi:type IV pilus assembly protein PilE